MCIGFDATWKKMRVEQNMTHSYNNKLQINDETPKDREFKSSWFISPPELDRTPRQLSRNKNNELAKRLEQVDVEAARNKLTFTYETTN